MSRIDPVDPADSEGTNRAVFQKTLNEIGAIPAILRVAGNRPPVLATLASHVDAVMGDGLVPRRLKELIAARVAQLTLCESELVAHTANARRLGAKAEQFEAMESLCGGGSGRPAEFPPECLGTAPHPPPPGADPADENLFTPAERAALLYAEQVSRGSGHVFPESFQLLQEHFEPAAIVEITAAVGLADYTCRLSNALEIAP